MPLQSVKTGNRPAWVIAEAGVNHNGSLEMARRLIDAAVAAGADAVKFQTFRATELVCRKAPKADYQLQTTDSDESQFDMLKRLELDQTAHEELIDYCKEQGILFLSSPFDSESLAMLVDEFSLPLLKLGSGELTNAPLLLQAAQSGTSLILSTGMATLDEIEIALGVLACGYTCRSASPSAAAFRDAFKSEKGQAALQKRVVLLHCTTEYPTPPEEVNLLAMETLKEKFHLPVGLSDHTPGIVAAIAAAARGAVIIEKHFTLDRALPGPDHKASILPGELRSLVAAVKEVALLLGSAAKAPAQAELKNIAVARKSLVAAEDIRRGEHFTAENLCVKRPGTGIPPIHYWEWLGRRAERDFAQDEVIGA